MYPRRWRSARNENCRYVGLAQTGTLTQTRSQHSTGLTAHGEKSTLGRTIVAKLAHGFYMYCIYILRRNSALNRYHSSRAGGLSRFLLGSQFFAHRVAFAFVGSRTVQACDSSRLVGRVYSFREPALADCPSHGPQAGESQHRLRFSVEK
jgi:hypothetical protein